MGEEAVDEGESFPGGFGGGGYTGGAQTLRQGPQSLLRRRRSHPFHRHFGLDLQAHPQENLLRTLTQDSGDHSFVFSYKIVPAAILAVFVHPHTSHLQIHRMLWSFCVYLESVAVLPQLRMMQKAKMIEPFTAHYVFALGIARFLELAHWIIQVYESGGKYLYLAGRGYLWIPAVFVSEMVQSFILADFCYYYVKSAMRGQLLVTLRSPV
nr:putative ER lumen protein-retaining receptor C28H8.4 [Ipomoea batatas]